MEDNLNLIGKILSKTSDSANLTHEKRGLWTLMVSSIPRFWISLAPLTHSVELASLRLQDNVPVFHVFSEEETTEFLKQRIPWVKSNFDSFLPNMDIFQMIK